MSTYLLTIFLLGPLTLTIMFWVVYAKQLYLQNSVNALYNEMTASAAPVEVVEINKTEVITDGSN